MATLSIKKVLAVIVIVAIISVGATYASISSRSSSASVTTTATVAPSTTGVPSGGTLVFEQAATPDTLDPAVAWDYSEEAVQQVYQGLMVFAPNSTSPVPYIAQSYNVSSDGLTYNFQIKTGITFSNGDPVNAYVFWYSIYRAAVMAQSPSYLITVALNTTSVTASMLNQYNSTTPPPSLLTIMENANNAITVTAPYSIQFHLMAPFSAFLATLTQPQDSAVDPAVVSAHGGVVAGQTNNWMTVNALGTGPFVIASLQPGVETDYKKNPTYWGGTPAFESTAHVDEVVAKAVPNALTRLEDVESGSAQVAYVDFTLTPKVLGQPGLYFPNIGAGAGVNWLAMDIWKAPFNNVLVREAVCHAINVTSIIQLWQGFATGFVGPIPQGVLGHNSNLQPYSYNITLAKQLLAQAGYPNGQGLPTLLFVYPSDTPPATQVAEVVQANLAEIGLKVTLQGMTSGVMTTTLDSDKNPADPHHADLMYSTWAWFPDPWAFADWFIGPLDYGASNMAWYNNTQAQNLVNKADATTDPTLRAQLLENASAIAYNDYPYVWLSQQKNALVQGVPVTSINVQGYRNPPTLQMLGVEFSNLYLTSPPTSG